MLQVMKSISHMEELCQTLQKKQMGKGNALQSAPKPDQAKSVVMGACLGREQSFVDRYEYHMNVCSKWCLSGRAASWPSYMVRTYKHYWQTFPPNLFIPAMIIGAIDVYCSIPLSVTLTLAGGHKVSAKQILLASFSHTLFN